MKLRRRYRLVAIKKGKATKGLRADIRKTHRLSAHHKTKNPRKKFLFKIQHTKLRTFGVPRAGTHIHHGTKRNPMATRKARKARTYRKPRSYR